MVSARFIADAFLDRIKYSQKPIRVETCNARLQLPNI